MSNSATHSIITPTHEVVRMTLIIPILDGRSRPGQLLYQHIEIQQGEKKSLAFRFKKVNCRGFPGGSVVESLPANTGDTGLSSGLGGSHMPRSNWAREPQLLSLRVWSLCSATREAAIVRGPRSPQLEKALAQKRRPNTEKINKFII